MGEIGINRAVHLAIRDRNFEYIIEIVKSKQKSTTLLRKIKNLEGLRERLNEAEEAARAALRGCDVLDNERFFVTYLALIKNSSEAALTMLKHEHQINTEKELILAFLGQETGEMLAPYQNCCDHIMDGIQLLVSVAEETFNRLKTENYNELSKQERKRYKLACNAFEIKKI